MTNGLTIVIIVAALLVAGHALVAALRNRAMDLAQLISLGVLEFLLAAQAVVGFVKLSGGEGPESTATFVGYLIGALVLPVAAAGWGLLERTRWGPGVIVVAALGVAVMIVRLDQLWSGTGG